MAMKSIVTKSTKCNKLCIKTMEAMGDMDDNKSPWILKSWFPMLRSGGQERKLREKV